MRSNIAAMGVRAGIVTLAALSMTTLAAGAASASPAREAFSARAAASADCTAVRHQIEILEARILALEELMETATTAQKNDIMRTIRRLEAQIGALEESCHG